MKTRKGIGKSLELSLNERIAKQSAHVYSTATEENNAMLHSNRTKQAICVLKLMKVHNKKKSIFLSQFWTVIKIFAKILYYFLLSPNKLCFSLKFSTNRLWSCFTMISNNSTSFNFHYYKLNQALHIFMFHLHFFFVNLSFI